MFPSRQTLFTHNLGPKTCEHRTVSSKSPPFRHAVPSAPWPWVDIDDEINDDQMRLMNAESPPIPGPCDHINCGGCWRWYPESRFPNWTPMQVQKSKIIEAIQSVSDKECVCHYVDIDEHGFFRNADKFVAAQGKEEETWKNLVEVERPPWSKTRAIFVEDMSGPVLQMLGTIYNIDPFFFSSCLNRIPSRYQEDVRPGCADHITITLTFLRSISAKKMPDYKGAIRSYSGHIDIHSIESHDSQDPQATVFEESIDTKAPLKLRCLERYLCLDFLSVHLIRNVDGNTIISYHPNSDMPTTRAEELHDRIRFAGQNVYWQKMLQESSDPTFVLLIYLWHAMYSWDQALEHLYDHICQLESNVIDTGKWKMTQDYIVRAHQLLYASLLRDFRKTVEFIRKHENPAMMSFDQSGRKLNRMFLERECDNLLIEINRLEENLAMQKQRLKNVMKLVFCSVNISDNKLMKGMTETAMRDSAVMKQIAYLTMVFLPASFVASIFGMNTHEIAPGTNGDLRYYVACAIPLTLLTIWVVIASQYRYLFEDKLLVCLGWPYFLFHRWWTGKRVQKKAKRDDCEEEVGTPGLWYMTMDDSKQDD